ncbi:hypothetical protein [Wenzhou pacific spadenose shark paramyxovirus]|uniref:Uncharacterized protein n=1 Tax=Wenzhou pacific spadenose shark paramyxovirus TaxID=2116452 RepID=A0A2P1GMZ9_9MONO|nr:hypothetical protein QKD25_gp06 [Wenzhou pacific spadenose shark paramyxovirus]AVM87361.1 hypothetical protein [Wenzhou pacific spadenose shark paramyxovirus]
MAASQVGDTYSQNPSAWKADLTGIRLLRQNLPNICFDAATKPDFSSVSGHIILDAMCLELGVPTAHYYISLLGYVTSPGSIYPTRNVYQPKGTKLKVVLPLGCVSPTVDLMTLFQRLQEGIIEIIASADLFAASKVMYHTLTGIQGYFDLIPSDGLTMPIAGSMDTLRGLTGLGVPMVFNLDRLVATTIPSPSLVYQPISVRTREATRSCSINCSVTLASGTSEFVYHDVNWSIVTIKIPKSASHMYIQKLFNAICEIKPLITVSYVKGISLVLRMSSFAQLREFAKIKCEGIQYIHLWDMFPAAQFTMYGKQIKIESAYLSITPNGKGDARIESASSLFLERTVIL